MSALVALGAASVGTFAFLPILQIEDQPVAERQIRSRYATEQDWIKDDIVSAIAGMVAPERPRPAAPAAVIEHVWSPGTYAPLAEQLIDSRLPPPAASGETADLDVRAALTDLRVEALLEQNERVSSALQRDVLSADAQESAALLVGALALRESVGLFGDVRPALSRMAAHMAVARAVRRSSEPSMDGRCAMAILTALAGLERQAIGMVDDLERHSSTDTDRAWVRALRLRITGDWRAAGRTDTLLEKLELARALRGRLGIDRFLDYLDSVPPGAAADWHRIAFANDFSVEAGRRFTENNVELDLAEAGLVWTRLHGGRPIVEADLVAALNERPPASPAERVQQTTVAHVLDWGTWAAFEQRQLCMSLVSRSRHLWSLGAFQAQRDWQTEQDRRFGGLTLYSLVLRWGAPNADIYTAAMAGARVLVERSPELVTAAEWNYLLTKSGIQGIEVPFPLDDVWFTPAVPEGTAFDLRHDP